MELAHTSGESGTKSYFSGGERQSFRPKFVAEMKCGFARTGFGPAGARDETWRFSAHAPQTVRVCTVGGGASRHAYTCLRARQRDDTCYIKHVLSCTLPACDGRDPKNKICINSIIRYTGCTTVYTTL